MERHETNKRLPGGKITRRSALRLAGGAGAAAFAASRGGLGGRAAQSTPAAAAKYPVVLEKPPITIFDYGIKLPTDDVKYRWADHQGVRVPFQKAFHAAFMEAHPNIHIEYDSLGQDIVELLAVGIQSGNAHDVFPMAAGIQIPQAVAEGWISPLDDVMPNFAEWKAAFPEGSFLPGINVFDGKTYCCPMYSTKLDRTLLFFNADFMEKAGYNPMETPLNWDTFREAGKKLTEQGKGKYFGMVMAGGPGAIFVRTIAEIAGGKGEFDWKTGQYAYTSDEMLAALDLMFAMKDDGSFHPGMTSMTDTDVRGRFPQGLAGMYISGIWNISIWQQAAPDFKFGVSTAPVPNQGEPYGLHVPPASGEGYLMYSGSKYKEVTAALFSYVGSLEGNIALKKISKAINPVAFPEADKAVDPGPIGTKALEINYQQMLFRPHPAVRNIDATKVDMETRSVTPSFDDVVQGLYTGQLKDAKKAMQDLQDRSEKELDRAIKAAQGKGAKVTRDDWVFPNWDPRKDYTLDDYKQLK